MGKEGVEDEPKVSREGGWVTEKAAEEGARFLEIQPGWDVGHGGGIQVQPRWVQVLGESGHKGR